MEYSARYLNSVAARCFAGRGLEPEVALPTLRVQPVTWYGRFMPLDLSALPATAAQFASRAPSEIVALALAEYSPDLGLSFSGAEDVVLNDMAVKCGAPFRVFSLDTGRLHPETY